MTLKSYELSYIAGIIDGEGQISLTRHKTRTGEFKCIIRSRIGIFNTNKDVIMWIKNKVNQFKLTMDKPDKPTHKACYRLHIDKHKEQVIFLENIIPYLIIKKKQARLLLKFIKKRLTKNKKRFDNEDLKMYNESILLNRKGVQPLEVN